MEAFTSSSVHSEPLSLYYGHRHTALNKTHKAPALRELACGREIYINTFLVVIRALKKKQGRPKRVGRRHKG